MTNSTSTNTSAVSTTGLSAFCFIAQNTGKKPIAPHRLPASMIFLRPMRSESAPKNTKNGMPSASAEAITIVAVMNGTFSVFCRK